MGTEPVDYCREIEAYLCQKNGGHLIRVVGPSFGIVSGWAAKGVPFKIACRGIDRYFERRRPTDRQPRRRPVRIDFCDADVLDAYDEWRRAVGVTETTDAAGASLPRPQSPAANRQSLPAHLERVLLRLTAARVRDRIDAGFDDVLDRVSRELDRSRAEAGGVRGAARAALLERLQALDREMLDAARARLDAEARARLGGDAEDELSAFRTGMTPEAFARAREAALDRLVRERFGLPTVAFS